MLTSMRFVHGRYQDLRHTVESVTVQGLAVTELITCDPSDAAHGVLVHLDALDIDQIPVRRASGGGTWYTNTLKGLEPGNRIWVYVPGHGYGGVGEVVESAQPITDFTVDDEHAKERPITEVLTNTPGTGCVQ